MFCILHFSFCVFVAACAGARRYDDPKPGVETQEHGQRQQIPCCACTGKFLIQNRVAFLCLSWNDLVMNLLQTYCVCLCVVFFFISHDMICCIYVAFVNVLQHFFRFLGFFLRVFLLFIYFVFFCCTFDFFAFGGRAARWADAPY